MPRVRYNVHDRGGLVEYAAVRRRLDRFGFDLDRLGSRSEVAGPRGPLPWARPIPLPFLWIHGRSDATISVMGANIYPEDIEVVLYRDPELARRIHSFMLRVVADADGTPRPSVALELTDLAGVDEAWRATVADQLGDGLLGLNIDYRSSTAEFPAAMHPIVETYGVGEGPFAADAGRIKQRRIVSA